MDRDEFTPFPDTAMASGSDAGEPGEHLGPADLQPDEQRLLRELERDAPGPPPDEDVDLDDVDLQTVDLETVDLETEAAEDERPLPDQGGAQDDGLSPRFTAPEGE